jgi:molybdopterin-guanine dinucleotide biosynthesis protein A
MPSASGPADGPPTPVRCAILAGGRATRFGGLPKGLTSVGGKRILDRLVEATLAAFGTLPILVANDPDAASWRADLSVVADLVPGAGALGGLYTAVVKAPAPVVCVAWDLPFVTPPLLLRLARGLDRADVVIPATTRGFEPLCAGYGPGTVEPIRAAIAAGDLRATGFHGSVAVSLVTPADLEPFGDPATLFFNVNEPGDLARAEALIAR